MEKLQQIAELKKQIPHVQCKGLCWRSCAGIDLTPLERNTIKERHGIEIALTPLWRTVASRKAPLCRALGEDRRCKIWHDKEVYPAICSGFGAVEHLKCPFGCVPEGGEWMRVEDFKLLLADIEDIGGSYVTTPMDRVRLRQRLATRTGREKERLRLIRAMEAEHLLWREYIERNPDNLPLGEK